MMSVMTSSAARRGTFERDRSGAGRTAADSGAGFFTGRGVMAGTEDFAWAAFPL
jgi:hypothetical protein